MVRSKIVVLVALALALSGAAASDDREVMELSDHGAVLGPMDHAASPEDTEAAIGTFFAGLEHLVAGRYEAAADLFDRLAESTGWPEASYNGALAWYGHGRFDVALKRADDAVTGLPGDPGAAYLQGVLLQAVGRYEDARVVLERSLAATPEASIDRVLGLLNLAASSRLVGRPDEALERFREARRLAEELDLPGLVASAWMGEGLVFLSTGERAAADAALASARRLGKRKGHGAAEVDADLSLAAVALADGETQRARRLLEGTSRSIADLPEPSVRASMLLTVAELQRELGEVEAASVSLEEAVRLFDSAGLEVGRAHVLQYRGAWALQDGDLVVAERYLAEALAIQDRFQVPLARADTARHLADLRSAQGRLDEALELARSSVATFADARAIELERASLVVLAGILSQRGELTEARAAASRAVELAELVGDKSEGHRLGSELVILDAAAGDIDGALQRLGAIPGRAFAALPPRQRGRVHLQLSWSLREAGRADEAISRARHGLDAATEPEPDEADLVASCREAVVFGLLDAGRLDDAQAFVDALGPGGSEQLGILVASRRTVDTYNEGAALLQAGQLEEAAGRFEQIVNDDAADPDRREVARDTLAAVLRQHGQELFAAGKTEKADAALERAVELARQSGDAEGQGRGLVLRAQVHESIGAGAEAAQYATEAAGLVADAEPELAGDCWMIAGQALFESDPEGSREAFRRALQAWGDGPSTLGKRASVTYNLAALDLQLGAPGEARVRLREARVLADQAGDKTLVDAIDGILEQLEAG